MYDQVFLTHAIRLVGWPKRVIIFFFFFFSPFGQLDGVFSLGESFNSDFL